MGDACGRVSHSAKVDRDRRSNLGIIKRSAMPTIAEGGFQDIGCDWIE